MYTEELQTQQLKESVKKQKEYRYYKDLSSDGVEIYPKSIFEPESNHQDVGDSIFGFMRKNTTKASIGASWKSSPFPEEFSRKSSSTAKFQDKSLLQGTLFYSRSPRANEQGQARRISDVEMAARAEGVFYQNAMLEAGKKQREYKYYADLAGDGKEVYPGSIFGADDSKQTGEAHVLFALHVCMHVCLGSRLVYTRLCSYS
jgi:hypothetical protein